jgi:DNA-binding SARP family transcriptional activator/ABC-type branched-subunit amino acid transport system substrate-binding protein
MEFRILGPLDALDDEGRRVDLGGHKQRALLAALLLRANEVVSQDVLVEELWGESPPPTATKTLQAYVSRLRKAVAGAAREPGSGDVLLETRGRGYLLRVAPGSLDAAEFERLVEEGRQSLARDDPKRAADRLRTALALWRGPALADLQYESFAQADIARLEELRLAALEDRVEADLALGRDTELIPELETLVERHPLRERLRGQLMLALYRADRQAQALQVYQQGRQLLAQELGLHPGEALRQLERQVLDQDPALTVTRPRERPAIVPAPLWRHPRRVIAAGGALVAVAAGLAVLQLTRDATTVEAAGALVLDPVTGVLEDALPLGTAPSSVAVGEGSVWVLDADDKTVTKIDPAPRTVERDYSTSSTPSDIAAGAGALWIGNAPTEGLTDFPESVSRVDPESGIVLETIPLPPAAGGHPTGIGGFSRQKLAAASDAVWVVNPDQSVSRIDPRTNRVVARIQAKAQTVAAGEGDVWVAEDGQLAEIDAGTNTVSRRVPLDVDFVAALAVGAGAVWVADPLDGSLRRVDRNPPFAKRRIDLARWVNGVTFGSGAVWATNEIGDEVYRIDPRTNDARVVVRTASPRGIGAGSGAAWVAAASPPSRDATLPTPVCGEVFYGGTGRPQLLLVSDLPLKGAPRETTLAMTDGLRHILEQRGFEAGGYSVGYQSCDSATAQSGDSSDFFRCGSNAKAYARNLRVVGIFGSFQSPCSYVQIPIANQAPEGQLAMLSPSNTLQELTESEEFYPSGLRNYVRIAGADHLQAVAHAELARQLGARRATVVSSRGDDGFGRFAEDVGRAGRQLGLDVTTMHYDNEAPDFVRFARAVARTRPEAVVIADILYPETGRLIRDLRAELGPDVAIIAPDGFGLYDDLVMLAGDASEGMYVSQYGIANAKLPPRGKQFLRSFAAAQGSGPGPDYAAAYGAQAAEIFLDAIARSDGTRASVTRELFRARVDDGILGDIRFDRNGDPVNAPFTVYRMTGESNDGIQPVVDRVVVARSALLRAGG